MDQQRVNKLKTKTINDFGAQWTQFTTNQGYYGSVDVFHDILGPLMDAGEIKGKKVAEIGSGTGRIIRMLNGVGAAEMTAVEPSIAVEVLRENIRDFSDKVTIVNAPGDQIPQGDFDMVFSIGVLHHIPEPEIVVRKAYEAIKTNGKMVIWLYGKEGNELYLIVYKTLRFFTSILPRWFTNLMSHALLPVLNIYCGLASKFKLPMWQYMRGHIAKLNNHCRRLTIFDQLNPSWAKYYTKEEAFELLNQAGFKNIKMFNRHGYSWSVVGEKA